MVTSSSGERISDVRSEVSRNSSLYRLTAWFAGGRKGIISFYSIVFLLVLLCVFATLFLYGKSIIPKTDGLQQGYTYFVYVGEWLRSLFPSLISTGAVPMWEPSMGYGADVFSTIGSSIADPFNWISVFVPSGFAEYVYGATVIARLYCAGLAFMAFTRYRSMGRFESLVGALCYVFAGSTVVIFVQGGSLATMIIFPLILLGIDKVLDRSGFCTLVFSWAWVCAIGVASAYVMGIFGLIYSASKLIRVARKNDMGTALWGLARLAGCALLGLGIAAVFLLPIVMNSMLGMDRLEVVRNVTALYEPVYYVDFLSGFISHADLGADGYMGFGPLAFIVICLLFIKRKDNTLLFWTFLALTIAMLLPFFGSALNAFQYPNTRWSWAYAFCVAYAVAKLLPDLESLSMQQRVAILGAAVLYGAALLLIPNLADEAFLAEYAVLIGLSTALVFCGSQSRRAFGLLIVASVCIGGVINYTTYLSPSFEDGVYRLANIRKAYSTQASSTAAGAVDGVSDDSVWRYDESGRTPQANSSLFLGIKGINFYSSYYNNDIDRFHTSLGYPSSSVVQYIGWDSRSAIEALMGVKYFVAGEGDIVPYQFRDSEPVTEKGKWDVYQTDVRLPLAYTYENTIDEVDFDSLNVVQKQEALLQAAVVEDGAVSSVNELDIDSWEVPFEVSSAAEKEGEASQDGDAESAKGLEDNSTVEFFEGGFNVLEDGATVYLRFDEPADSEMYLSFEDLEFNAFRQRETYSDEEWGSMGTYKRRTVQFGVLTEKLPIYSRLEFESGDMSRRLSLYSNRHNMYGGHHDFTVNLGGQGGRTEVSITFERAGTYSYSSLELLAEPMEEFDDQVASLAKYAPTDLDYEGNVITGTLSVPDERYLYFSVPYSKGWTAYVDGRAVDIEQMNIAFMGVKVSAGEHSFELRFETPYLRVGFCISVASLVAVAGLCLLRRNSDAHR